MDRIKYEITDILAGIAGSPDEVGYDVSVSKVYDDIKHARFEEDSSVSFGVWERELKKADWELTEKLAVEALKTKSKDFQILGWLIEALVVLDGFTGIARGITVLTEFSKAFWITGYPRKDDNSSDTEQKQHICEWIFNIVAQRSKFIPFIKGDDTVNLYQYEYALDLKNTAIRSPNSSSEILENARKDGHSTLEDIENKVNGVSQTEVDSVMTSIGDIRNAKTTLDEAFKEIVDEEFNSFSGLMKNLDTIERIMNRKNSKDLDNEAVVKNVDISKRDEIYNKISALSKQLSEIERHSPSSFILNLVVSWKDKNLIEIMDDLKTGHSEAHKLLKFLVN